MNKILTNINFIGTYPRDISGYGNHTAGLVNAFYEQCNEEFSIGWECGLVNGWELQVSNAEFKMLSNVNNGVQVMITMPHIAPIRMSDKPTAFLQYCVFEGDRIPQYWAEILNKPEIDFVLVPSQHVFDACINTGVNKDKLRVLHHGVNHELFKPVKKVNPDGKFVFVFNGGWAKD